jgi:hypothetical protein
MYLLLPNTFLTYPVATLEYLLININRFPYHKWQAFNPSSMSTDMMYVPQGEASRWKGNFAMASLF